ncbi:UDP-GalNAc:beta-1,3-N-acetylgalactosaminyltransferase 2-like [Argopecten irradians]|uniref:UDP-GalNAc:beta-1, 3-N-acetylgalactosaminyltransferase 2-like n=1 Tax=Argopecten irradians TaxID=31199 RepID=UPI003718DA3B
MFIECAPSCGNVEFPFSWRERQGTCRQMSTMCNLRSMLTIVVVAVIAFVMQYYGVVISLKKVFDSRYCQWPDQPGDLSGKPYFDLAVGILSSRDHFEARATIRETWLKELNGNERGHGWFVVGDTDCDLHPEAREDQYCCREWLVTEPVKKEDIQVVTTEKVTVSGQRKPSQVLHFKVMHPVVISRIGLLEAAMVNTSAIQVSLMNRSTDGVLTTATFSRIDPGIPKGQFLFQPVQAVRLPKGFEGYLNVDLDNDQIVHLYDKLPSLTYTTIISNVSGVLLLQVT